MSELSVRLASGLVMAALALGTAWVGGVTFECFWILSALLAAAEWIVITNVRPSRERTVLAAFGLLLLGAAAVSAARSEGSNLVAISAIVLALVFQLLWRGQLRDRLWACAGVAYAAALLAAPLYLRHDPQIGLRGIWWMFAVVWATDTAAYACGRAIGGVKFFPSISPQKTWSGFVGGVVTGTAAGTLVVGATIDLAFTTPLGLVGWCLLSCFAAVGSQFGDLAESALKRHFQVKDSSKLIPGHGGVLDRLDGFFAVSVLVLGGLGVRTVFS